MKEMDVAGQLCTACNISSPMQLCTLHFAGMLHFRTHFNAAHAAAVGNSDYTSTPLQLAIPLYAVACCLVLCLGGPILLG
jgi:hypothetical protein